MAENTIPRSDSAAYMREYRRRRPAVAERERLKRSAYQGALMELSYRHPEEFDELLKVEQALVGLEPTGVGFPGRPLAQFDGGEHER